MKIKSVPTPNDDDMQAELFDEDTAIVVCAVYKASEVSPAGIVNALNEHARLEKCLKDLLRAADQQPDPSALLQGRRHEAHELLTALSAQRST